MVWVRRDLEAHPPTLLCKLIHLLLQEFPAFRKYLYIPEVLHTWTDSLSRSSQGHVYAAQQIWGSLDLLLCRVTRP